MVPHSKKLNYEVANIARSAASTRSSYITNLKKQQPVLAM
jgi:hypothetical protein